jgi:hypothetical protein
MKKLPALVMAMLVAPSTASYGGDADELSRAVAHRESVIVCGPPLVSQRPIQALFLCTDAEPPEFGPETTLWLAVEARFNL